MNELTLSANTRNKPKSSRIEHCVTILRCKTLRSAGINPLVSEAPGTYRRLYTHNANHGDTLSKHPLHSQSLPALVHPAYLILKLKDAI